MAVHDAALESPMMEFVSKVAAWDDPDPDPDPFGNKPSWFEFMPSAADAVFFDASICLLSPRRSSVWFVGKPCVSAFVWVCEWFDGMIL